MDFSGILDRKMEEIEAPKAPPMGWYVATITKLPEQDSFTSQKGDEFLTLTFPMILNSAEEDVDEDLLAEFGDVSGFYVNRRFLIPADETKERDIEVSLHRIRKFLECFGSDDPNHTLNEAITAAVNGQGRVNLGHRPDSTDVTTIYADVKGTAPLE